MKYVELKEKHSREIDGFPVFFAFSNQQLEEGLEKLAVTKENICSIGSGGFVAKNKRADFDAMFSRWEKESKDALKDDAFLADAIIYELNNHEYGYTMDPEPALDAIGVSLDDERVNKIFNSVRAQCVCD